MAAWLDWRGLGRAGEESERAARGSEGRGGAGQAGEEEAKRGERKVASRYQNQWLFRRALSVSVFACVHKELANKHTNKPLVR